MYQVYLIEDITVNNYKELECEGVDFATVFAVADVADIANRKDNITKQINFKGTKNNNEAFGSMFHLNHFSNFELSNKLFFNYNPLRTVECLIYEDGALLLRGSLRVLEITVDGNGNVTYSTVVTGAFIDFKQVLSDKLLSDLNLEDLQHRYTWSNISNSWSVQTERYNPFSSSYSNASFNKGDGYIYPFLDYGSIFAKADSNVDINNIHLSNFRPAIYAKEYFDRIFNQNELNNYTYEVKGDEQLISAFNSLIIPNNTEKLTSQSATEVNTRAYVTGANYVHSTTYEQYNVNYLERAIELTSGLNSDTSQNLFNPFGSYGTVMPNAVFMTNRTFTASGYVRVKFDTIKNLYFDTKRINVQLVQRSFVASGATAEFNSATGWNVVAQSSFTLIAAHTITNKVVEFEVPERTYESSSQLMVRMFCDQGTFTSSPFSGVYNIQYKISEGEMKFSRNGGMITYEVNDGDVITPQAPVGVKQIDFVKSVIALFNFYVYTEKENPKKLIFQTYDDYYGFASPKTLKNNSLDWTNKIDYTNGFKMKSNVDIPKKYLFTLKEDSDFINANYKKNYSSVYGSFQFDDTLGVIDQKKVEVIFSPSPLVTYLGTGRIHPAIYTIDGNNKKPSKSNIRILFYNGLKSCTTWKVGKDVIVANEPATAIVASGLTTYPQCGNYLFDAGINNMVPKRDLYFSIGKEVYFTINDDYTFVPTAYQLYYQGQTTDITNPNITYVSCDVYLNEIDISNLNLRVPVFVDMGEMGHAYFKVLNVEYSANNSTAKVTLQKIAV